jgi:hypothetical protein
MLCPTGYTTRKSYVRTFKNNVARSGFTVRRKGKTFTAKPTKSSIYVPSHCVKKPSTNQTAKIGKLRKGELLKYGYQYRLSDKMRHKALEKAVKVYGATSLYHKLDAISKLSVHVAPDASMIFKKDRDWVHAHL